MRKILARGWARIAIAALALGLIGIPSGWATPPGGFLDLANGLQISGWARDTDYDGPIWVHIYIDGQMTQRLLADSFRPDVQNHAFGWTHEPYGYGTHTVTAYAIGVDANGVATGENVPIGTKTFDVGLSEWAAWQAAKVVYGTGSH